MPLVVADRVRETSNTTGTGTLTLAGAVTGFRTFSSGIGNGNTTYYSISNPNNNQWEVGLGTVGAGTLARTTVLASSNANALVNFTAGPLDVFCTYPAGKSVNLDEVNNLELNSTWNQGTGILQVTGSTSTSGNTVSRNVVLAGGNNLLTFSEQLDNAAWTKSNTTVTANATAAPNGTTTADKLVEDTANSTHGISQLPTLTATRHTFSFYARAAERNWLRITCVDGVAFVNLSTGVFGTVSAGTVSFTADSITSVGNGWYRVQVSFIAASGANTVLVRLTTGDGVNTYTGDGTSGAFLWGAQLEVGSVATQYTPTTTTAVTASNQVLASDGSLGLPSYAFSTEPSSGMYRIANQQVAFAINNRVVYGSTLSQFQVGSGQTIAWGSNANALFAAADVVLARDAANQLAQRNGTNAQTYNLYNTFTDASNYERFAITWSGNQLLMNAQALGTGVQRNIGIQTAGGTVSIGGTTARDRLTVINGSISLDNTRGINILDNAGTGESVINVTSANNLSIASPTLSGSIQYTVRNASGIHQFIAGGSERMRITSTGNVGIGTSSPATRLDVSGGDIRLSTNATYVRSVTTGGTSIRMLGINASNTAYVGPIDSGPTDTIFNASSSSTISAFYTGGSERMRIDASGNVGVGTTSPSARLSITTVPTTSTPNIQFAANNGGGTVQNLSGLQYYHNLSNGFSDSTFVYGNTTLSYFAIGSHNGTSYTERMRIDASGRVGIGTSSPTSGYLLDVAGGIKLSGAFDEGIFAVTGTTPALSPSNGTIQTWTLSGNSTPTAGTWNDGESMTMMILDGTAFTITWTSVAVTWVGGSAPTLDTTKQNVIELWRVGGVIYGALVGAA